MGRNSRPQLSKRLKRQYLDILEGDGGDWCYPYRYIRTFNKVEVNAMAAFFFAKQWRGRGDVDFRRLQNIVARSGNPEAAYRWAREIPESDVRKMQRVVSRFGSVQLIRAFAQNVPGADQDHLERICVVKEVLGC